MDARGRASRLQPVGWRASAGVGLALGVPAALGVGCLAAADLSDPLGALFAFAVYTPAVGVLLAGAGAAVVTVLRWPWRAWWWLVAVPWLPLFGVLASTDIESRDRLGSALGWAAGTLLAYVGPAVASGGRR